MFTTGAATAGAIGDISHSLFSFYPNLSSWLHQVHNFWVSYAGSYQLIMVVVGLIIAPKIFIFYFLEHLPVLNDKTHFAGGNKWWVLRWRDYPELSGWEVKIITSILKTGIQRDLTTEEEVEDRSMEARVMGTQPRKVISQ